MTLIHVIHSGAFYGAERMLLDHCLYVPGKHRVLFLNATEDLLNRFTKEGVDAVNCSGLLSLYRELRKQSGIVNAHNFRAQLFALLCAWDLSLPLIWTQHGFTPRSRKQRFYTWLGLKLGRSTHVRTVVCVSRGVAGLHRDSGVDPDKLRVIPNGLVPSVVPSRIVNTPLIGFVGRLSAEKGPDLFLDSILPLLRQRSDLQAVFIGDGPMMENLAGRVHDEGLKGQIGFVGYQQDMEAWLARLSVLVISSRTEGTPMILLEAMRAGTPVAAFGVGGIPDVMTSEEHGLLAAKGDCLELSRCVQRLLDDGHLVSRLTRSAQVRQATEYALPELATRWAALYQQAQEGVEC